MTRLEALLLAGHGIAYWPIWRWYAGRLNDGSDEPMGLVPLAVALLLHAMRIRASSDDSRVGPRLLIPSLLALLYALTPPATPVMVRATIVVLSIVFSTGVARADRLGIGGAGLLLLSLPVLPSLQFFFGYPMRVVAAEIAATLLRGNGLAALREGVGVRCGALSVAVDAPCSGVKMLWVALLVAALSMSVHRLSLLRSGLLAVLAVTAVVVGNGVRAASLFYIETGIIAAPAWAHDGAGLVVFAATAVGIVAAGDRLAKWRRIACVALVAT